MEGVAKTRAIADCLWQLLVSIWIVLQLVSHGIPLLYNFPVEFNLLSHHEYRQNLHNFSASVSVCPKY